jgi:hypothetical protein
VLELGLQLKIRSPLLGFPRQLEPAWYSMAAKEQVWLPEQLSLLEQGALR